MNKAQLIARRVRKGNNADQSAVLLEDLLRRFSGNNLAVALVYNGFATENGAHKFVTEAA